MARCPVRQHFDELGVLAAAELTAAALWRTGACGMSQKEAGVRHVTEGRICIRLNRGVCRHPGVGNGVGAGIPGDNGEVKWVSI